MSDDKLSPEVKEMFNKGAIAVTTINGKLAPWSPFGISPDPKDFSKPKESK